MPLLWIPLLFLQVLPYLVSKWLPLLVSLVDYDYDLGFLSHRGFTMLGSSCVCLFLAVGLNKTARGGADAADCEPPFPGLSPPQATAAFLGVSPSLWPSLLPRCQQTPLRLNQKG